MQQSLRRTVATVGLGALVVPAALVLQMDPIAALVSDSLGVRIVNNANGRSSGSGRDEGSESSDGGSDGEAHDEIVTLE